MADRPGAWLLVAVAIYLAVTLFGPLSADANIGAGFGLFALAGLGPSADRDDGGDDRQRNEEERPG